MCICLRSLVYCWTNILLNRLELFITNNNTGIRVKENKGRACLSPSPIIAIFHLHLTFALCVLVALSWPCVLPLPCTVQCSFDKGVSQLYARKQGCESFSESPSPQGGEGMITNQRQTRSGSFVPWFIFVLPKSDRYGLTCMFSALDVPINQSG